MTAVVTAPSDLDLRAGALCVELTAAGDVRAIRAGDLVVNQFLPGPHDGMAAGIYLRRHGADEVEVCAIVGSAPGVTSFEMGSDRAVWTGHSLGVNHTVELTLDDGIWVWRVSLVSADVPEFAPARYDVVVAQDLALSPPGTARTSEPYVCQYLAHRILDHPSGPAIASRQTMTAAPRLPLVVSAMVEGAAAYATDAMQTHTPLARLDAKPYGLADEMVSENYQYELATPTLVSRPLSVSTAAVVVHAYAVVRDDAPGDLADWTRYLDGWAVRAVEIAARQVATEPVAVTRSDLRAARLLTGRDTDGDDELLTVVGLGPDDVLLPEVGPAGRVLSFFTPDDAHVVRGLKDVIVERSHGHVLKAGDDVAPNDDVLSAASYAPGVFASHVVLGNTSANRLVTVHRHSLNLLRTSGVRVFVGKLARPGNAAAANPPSGNAGGAGTAHGLFQLGEPSVVTFHLGGVHWVYLTDLGRIDVRTVAAAHENRIDVLVSSERDLRILATIDVEQHEEGPWDAEQIDPETVRLTPAPGSDVAGHYPSLTYLVGSTAPITDDRALRHGPSTADTTSATAPVMLVTETSGQRLELTITGSLTEPERAAEILASRRLTGCDVDRELAGHRETVRELTLGLRFGGVSTVPTDELNALVAWYVHEALIHFLVPHGLEQCSGAAWGTRDVCQGPFELHLAFGRFDVARQILLTVFAHQMPAGDFPQWFMFDAYVDRYSDDAHGDVPVWPLFALGQYLRASGDLSVLDAAIPFWDASVRAPGTVPATLTAHVNRLLDYLDDHRLPGTALPTYGNGDWDDTLRPVDPAMRSTIASTWTSALLAQAAGVTADALGGSQRQANGSVLGAVLRQAGLAEPCGAALERAAVTVTAAVDPERAARAAATGAGLDHSALADRLRSLSRAVAADLRDHMLVHGVLAGYLNRVGGQDLPVIHPSDRRAGISYRLIPMTRSIIAGILDPREAAAHEALIWGHLHFPDGVRLMDRPPAFDDGVPRVLLQTKQSANAGREIGLMYTHAHVRWVEALAALGKADALRELLRISPLGINSRLRNAAPRQRNVYYSSSDAAFADRYDFAEGFDRLRTGDVAVKGGWRVSSSGPGILLRQLIQGVLGLTIRARSLVVDPVLPVEADGLTVEAEIAGERRLIRYVVREGVEFVKLRGGPDNRALARVGGTRVANRYRSTGLEVPIESLRGCAVLEVTVPVGR